MALSPLQGNVDNSYTQPRLIRFDPFRHLPPEIVGLINGLLDPPDTERLRRVCKSWKALSEFFNDHGALERHFPTVCNSTIAEGDVTTAKLANVRFRQWLCYEQSLAAGLVQSVVRACEITVWDIRNHLLVSGNSSGRVLIRTLRSGSNNTCPDRRQLSLKTILQPFRKAKYFWLNDIFATVNGDIVTQLVTDSRQAIARVTSMGEVVWFMKHECSSLAVGAKCFYVIHVHGSVGGFYGLETLDLENGVSRARSTDVAPYRAPNSFGDLRMVLSADEALIAVKLKNELLCIFETSSGQLMYIEEPEPLGYDASDACWVYSTAKQ